MGLGDWIRDGLNYYVIGGWTDYGKDGFALRGRLVDMSDKPYAAAALAKIDELAADGLKKDEQNQVVTTFMKGLVDHVKTLPADKQYATFRDEVSFLAGGETAGMLATFDKAPAHVQQALMNAVTNNPEFIDHITKNGTGSLASLLTQDNLNAYGNQMADILNTIANKPGPPPDGYDFKKLDQLGKDAKAFFEENAKGDKADQKKLAELQKALLNSVQGAGGNVSPLINLDMEMLMKFIHALMNGGLNDAIDGLAGDLGMKGEAVAEFRDLMQVPAGIMKFMGQDYYEFGMHYGPKMVKDGTDYLEKWDNVANGKRVEGPKAEEEKSAAAEIVVPQTRQMASADYSDLTFRTEPVARTGQTMGGVTKMSAGAWGQAHDNTLPTVSDRQFASLEPGSPFKAGSPAPV